MSQIQPNDSLKLRQIADWLDKVDQILPKALAQWDTLPDDTKEFFEGQEMQEDLRRIADILDAIYVWGSSCYG
jgi:hypothetical protein